MRLRSLLFVPGDRPERMDKALASGADALILDLEDSVAPARKSYARDAVSAFLERRDHVVKRFVRVNSIESGLIEHDLVAILDALPDALVLPKSAGAKSVETVSALSRAIPILPIATETPAAIFQLGTYSTVKDLLVGLTWGAEDLPAAIGATQSRHGDGSLTSPYEMVRALALFAAHAAEVAAIETVYPDFRDMAGLEDYAQRARRDGFSGMMAIHPSQVPIINAAFTPTEHDVDRARRIVAAFAASPESGVLQIEGKMIDRPHLTQALRILDQAGIAMARDNA